MTPDLCDVERILIVISRLLFRHDLYIHRPLREIASFNRFVKILAHILAIHTVDLRRFFIRKILDALLCLKMEFAPNALIFLIIEGKCVFAEEVHIAE